MSTSTSSAAGDREHLDALTATFVEDFAHVWASSGSPRMEGRVLALLLITEEPYLSSARISELLQASAGAVSMSTRALVSYGFLRPHSVPGDRSRYFRAEDDVWGEYLAGERHYLRRARTVIDYGLDILPEDAGASRTRLGNARRYMTWLAGYHRKMLTDWREYRDAPTEGVASAGGLDAPVESGRDAS